MDKLLERTVPASTPEPLSQTTPTNISLPLDKGKRTLPIDVSGRPEVEDAEILHQHRESSKVTQHYAFTLLRSHLLAHLSSAYQKVYALVERKQARVEYLEAETFGMSLVT